MCREISITHLVITISCRLPYLKRNLNTIHGENDKTIYLFFLNRVYLTQMLHNKQILHR